MIAAATNKRWRPVDPVIKMLQYTTRDLPRQVRNSRRAFAIRDRCSLDTSGNFYTWAVLVKLFSPWRHQNPSALYLQVTEHQFVLSDWIRI